MPGAPSSSSARWSLASSSRETASSVSICALERVEHLARLLVGRARAVGREQEHRLRHAEPRSGGSSRGSRSRSRISSSRERLGAVVAAGAAPGAPGASSSARAHAFSTNGASPNSAPELEHRLGDVGRRAREHLVEQLRSPRRAPPRPRAAGPR